MRTTQIRRDRTELRTLIVPGLQGSGPLHWQSLWQEEHPQYERVVQRDWCAADLDRWAQAIAATIAEHSGPALLVAHGYGCLAAAHAGAGLEHRIRGALLVAPPEPARFGAAAALRGARLGSHWVVVASRNDPWMPFERARTWAATWSSRLVDVGATGHLNADAGFGEWPAGQHLLDELRHEALDIESCTAHLRPMRSIAA